LFILGSLRLEAVNSLASMLAVLRVPRGERCEGCWLDSRMMRRWTGVALFAVAMMLLPVGTAGQSPVSYDATRAAPRIAMPAAAAPATTAPATARPDALATAALVAEYGRRPLSFELNDGQIAPAVKFLARGSGYSLFFTERSAVLSLTKAGAGSRGQRTGVAGAAGTADAAPKTDMVRMELVGASVDPKVSADEPLAGEGNYLIGKDESEWHTGVPTYARVRYTGVYPGVDLVYYGNQRQLEYDFVVAPGASARQVRVRFDGARRLRVGADGNLRIVAPNGEISFEKPVVYQMRDERRELVDGRFALKSKNEVGFGLGNYDAARELVIDPVLVYSTYVGEPSAIQQRGLRWTQRGMLISWALLLPRISR
jgi:hypothetical protein